MGSWTRTSASLAWRGDHDVGHVSIGGGARFDHRDVGRVDEDVVFGVTAASTGRPSDSPRRSASTVRRSAPWWSMSGAVSAAGCVDPAASVRIGRSSATSWRSAPACAPRGLTSGPAARLPGLGRRGPAPAARVRPRRLPPDGHPAAAVRLGLQEGPPRPWRAPGLRRGHVPRLPVRQQLAGCGRERPARRRASLRMAGCRCSAARRRARRCRRPARARSRTRR